MTMFGRDSIFTSLQSLPFAPELAATTLRTLGDWQGSRVDDFRDEDPGRILHEMRYGEMAAFEERPHSPYYGSVDATPLYVVLLDEYERWTGDRKLVRDLEYEARAALHWIDAYADRMGNGFISYKRRNEQTGLENQSWKDSWNSISYSDGRLPDFPRATCELQGYAYDAKMRGARLARLVWKDPAYADTLEQEAAELKRRFDRAFWLPDRGYYALALDADGSQVDALASNIGHLLWSGIVEPNAAKLARGAPHGPADVLRLGRADARRRRGPLQPDRLPPGHGLAVRQLDHRLGPAAVRLQGRSRRGSRSDILDAAEIFEGRLPEAFGGYDREVTKYPVPVPDGLQPAGVVDRRPVAPAADDARPGADGRSPHRAIRHCPARSGISSCSTSRAAGAGSTRSPAGVWKSMDIAGRRRGSGPRPGRAGAADRRPRSGARRRRRDRRRGAGPPWG